MQRTGEGTPLLGTSRRVRYGTAPMRSYLPFLSIPIAIMVAILGGLMAASIVTALRDPCPCSSIVEYNGTVANATGGAPIVPTSLPLVIAVIGDQALRTPSRQVLQLIRDENATLVMHQGDFDYEGAPRCWVDQLFGVLGNESDPSGLSLVADYFACMGNHDFEYKLRTVHAYSRRLSEQVHPVAAQCCCTGRVGVRATCVWENVVMLQIGAGTTSCFSSGIDGWIADELARLSDYPWKFCMFHKPSREMQLGAGRDDVAWEVYQACREGGAIVLNGHDHRYARTHLMSSFGPTQTIASLSNNLVVTPGESFAVISALGGHSIRAADPALLANPWWAASLNRGDPLASFGALFLRIGDASVGSDPRRAFGYFKTILGDTVDAFTVQV